MCIRDRIGIQREKQLALECLIRTIGQPIKPPINNRGVLQSINLTNTELIRKRMTTPTMAMMTKMVVMAMTTMMVVMMT